MEEKTMTSPPASSRSVHSFSLKIRSGSTSTSDLVVDLAAEHSSHKEESVEEGKKEGGKEKEGREETFHHFGVWWFY